MRFHLPLSFCLFPLILLSCHASVQTTSPVAELDFTTLDSFIKSSSEKPLLLEFYAPWCSHCLRFAPVYEKLALQLEREAQTARIDGSRYSLVSLRFRVNAFPSFYLIHAGTATKFVGPHSPEAIMEFVNSRGDRHGNKLSYFGGPLSPYWSAVSTVFWIASLTRQKVTQYQDRGGSLLFLVFCIVLGVISAFILAIHIITSPAKYTSPATTTRPHAE